MDEQEIVDQEEELVEVDDTDTETEEEQPEEDIDWKARAIKAEALIVKHKKAPEVKKAEQTKPQATPANIEETVLLANGMDEALIEELKLRAPKYGGSLIKAQNDPFFVAVKEKFEREKKSSQASLGASRGAGTAKVKKDFSTPGLSREDHMRLVREAQN